MEGYYRPALLNIKMERKEDKVKKNGKILLTIVMICIVLMPVTLIGCVENTELPTPNLPVLHNDLAMGKLVIEEKVPGESFIFCREYSTSYDAKNWRITDSKNLVMKTWLQSAPEGIVILVEHMHADVALKSKYESLDGWPQDSMDDQLHGGSNNQPGFWVTETYPYENIFAIEGFSETLISGWGFFCGSSIEETRLTETNLVKYGKVYGNKIQIVYDLLIKNADEPYFHTRSIIDEFLVPVVSE